MNTQNSLNDSLYSSFVRTEIDDSHDSFSKKIRSAAITKIPNLLIVGEKEQADKTVTWQRYGSKERQTLAFDHFCRFCRGHSSTQGLAYSRTNLRFNSGYTDYGRRNTGNSRRRDPENFAGQIARDVMVLFQKQMDPEVAAVEASSYLWKNAGTPEKFPIC
jgi:hypothetical protein